MADRQSASELSDVTTPSPVSGDTETEITVHLWGIDGFDEHDRRWAWRKLRYTLENLSEHVTEHTDGSTVFYDWGHSLDPAAAPRFEGKSRATADALRSFVAERDVHGPGTAHVFLLDRAFDATVGYGYSWGNANASSDQAVGYLNTGATSLYDDQWVTRNLLIHETLHQLIDAGHTDYDSEHHLGYVRAPHDDGDTRYVSPMATSYAGPNTTGPDHKNDTYWRGGDAVDHDAFYEHDGYTQDHRYEHEQYLSDATKRAVARTVENSTYV